MWLQSAVLMTIVAYVFGTYKLNDDTCLSDVDCSSDQACVWFSCIDPCSLTVCGTNHICDTVNHTTSCRARGKSKEFLVYDDQLNWYEALTYCDYKGMALATVESQEEQNALEAVLSQTSYAWWLGGSAGLKETNFTWTSTGKYMAYTNFQDGEPFNVLHGNDGRVNCLEIRGSPSSYKWYDDRCSYRQSFICEYYV